jgi:hypothetical protein
LSNASRTAAQRDEHNLIIEYGINSPLVSGPAHRPHLSLGEGSIDTTIDVRPWALYTYFSFLTATFNGRIWSYVEDHELSEGASHMRPTDVS